MRSQSSKLASRGTSPLLPFNHNTSIHKHNQLQPGSRLLMVNVTRFTQSHVFFVAPRAPVCGVMHGHAGRLSTPQCACGDPHCAMRMLPPPLFNVQRECEGAQVPRSFWSRVAGKYGNKFYFRDNGTEAAVTNAVSAINTCLREPAGKLKCANIQSEMGEAPTSGRFGKMFK